MPTPKKSTKVKVSKKSLLGLITTSIQSMTDDDLSKLGELLDGDPKFVTDLIRLTYRETKKRKLPW